MTDSILLERHSNTAVLTINNAKNYNALSSRVMKGLIANLKELSFDESVRAIVLTGAGDKAFCVGLDLKEISGETGVDMGGPGGRTMGVEAPLVKAFAATPQPIIAAVNGFAVTGGLEVALACDFMLCSDNAQFADTHALVGLLPGWGLSQKLPRLIGVNKAKEFSFTGRYIDAQEALEVGLVNRVFSSDMLLSEAIKIADRMAHTDRRALHAIKLTIDEGLRMPLADALILEGDRAEEHKDALDLSYLEERLKSLRELARKTA